MIYSPIPAIAVRMFDSDDYDDNIIDKRKRNPELNDVVGIAAVVVTAMFISMAPLFYCSESFIIQILQAVGVVFIAPTFHFMGCAMAIDIANHSIKAKDKALYNVLAIVIVLVAIAPYFCWCNYCWQAISLF